MVYSFGELRRGRKIVIQTIGTLHLVARPEFSMGPRALVLGFD